MIFECERFEAFRDAEFVPGSSSFSPGIRSALNRAQGSVRRFMECDPRIVLDFVSRCMEILENETVTDTHIGAPA